MKNLVQDGNVLDHTVTSGEASIASGAVVIEGEFIGIAVTSGTYANGDVIAVNLVGVYTVTKSAPLVITKGDKLYWNTSTGITKTASDRYIGTAWASAIEAATTVQVKLGNAASSTDGAGQAVVVAPFTGTLTGTANDALVDIAATAASTAGGSTPTAANVDAGIATAVASIVTGVNEQNKEFQTKINAILTALKNADLMASA